MCKTFAHKGCLVLKLIGSRAYACVLSRKENNCRLRRLNRKRILITIYLGDWI